jgi:hypothetical protein
MYTNTSSQLCTTQDLSKSHMTNVNASKELDITHNMEQLEIQLNSMNEK